MSDVLPRGFLAANIDEDTPRLVYSFSNEAVKRLASAPASDTLLELDLSNNRF